MINISSNNFIQKYNTYETNEVLTWCSGCGNYGIQNALKRALVLEEIETKDVLMCFDVGCNGNGSDKIGTYTIHGLHGRVLPLAMGAKIGNPKLTVIASAGDGATFSEGINHLIHAIRNNIPMLFILHDNQNYGLTTGQASSTTPKGCKMNTSPEGVSIDPIKPLAVILPHSPAFVAQTISSDTEHMTAIFRAALKVQGFAYIHVFQACPTYNKLSAQDGTQFVEDVSLSSNYDVFDMQKVRNFLQNAQKAPIGILYKNREKKSFFHTLKIEHPRNLTSEIKHYTIKNLY